MIPESILSFFHAGKSLPFRSMTYFNFLLEATLAGSLLIIVVLILRRVFRKQIGSRMVYLAWVLIALRLLVPIALPNPLMDEFRPTWSTDAEARPVADQIRVRTHDALSDFSSQLRYSGTTFPGVPNESPSQLDTFKQSLGNLTHEVATYTSYGWLGKAYLLLYVIGGLTVLTVFGVRHVRFRKKLKKQIVNILEGEQLALYENLCAQLGVKKLPVVYADPLPSPCLVGVFKPMIALPLTLPPESLCESLMHELYHYKAKDSWWVLVRCLCLAVHWFNPLVWLAQRYVQMDCELACDARVAAKLTDEERLHYANTLVTTAKQAYAPGAGVLATGMSMTGKRLKSRVNAILHLKAVRKVAAALVAMMLVVLTVGAFSTAESTAQQKRLTTCPSKFPFSENDVYPAPTTAFGEPIALTPLISATEAEAQAKRYLCALFPEDKAGIEQEYRFLMEIAGGIAWRIEVWPAEGGEKAFYYMTLKSGGGLDYVRQNIYTLGEEAQDNIPSVLPSNLKGVILDYAQQVSNVALQGIQLVEKGIRGDYDTDDMRVVVFEFTDAADGSALIDISCQIAPSFGLQYVSYMTNNGVIDEVENPAIEPETDLLAYSKDDTFHFDGYYWGLTEATAAIAPDAALSTQQAFDFAVEQMLDKCGITKSEFLKLTLEYGYDADTSFGDDSQDDEADAKPQPKWDFVWYVDQEDPQSRYWVSFTDSDTPSLIFFSKPGEGLG